MVYLITGRPSRIRYTHFELSPLQCSIMAMGAISSINWGWSIPQVDFSRLSRGGTGWDDSSTYAYAFSLIFAVSSLLPLFAAALTYPSRWSASWRSLVHNDHGILNLIPKVILFVAMKGTDVIFVISKKIHQGLINSYVAILVFATKWRMSVSE